MMIVMMVVVVVVVIWMGITRVRWLQPFLRLVWWA